MLAYPTNSAAYARLCRLLSLDKRRAGKARCRLDWSDLVVHGTKALAILVSDEPDAPCARSSGAAPIWR